MTAMARDDDAHEPRIVALETRMDRAEVDIDGLRRSQHTLADQLVEHGKTLLDHARILTQHAENIARSREEARQAKQAASELEHATKSWAEAASRHMGAIQTETSAQTAVLRTLVRWHQSPWFRAAVVIGAVLGGFVAALLMKGAIK